MSQTKEIRTRFAPSPTGFLHVGGARTALFNYLYARARGGKFILRVEDTDQERSTAGSEEMILDSLRWLGIKADEGPNEGGPHTPYRQSERLDTYRKYTKKLLDDGKAFYCFCTSEELEAKQNQSKVMGLPHVYDGKCRGLSREEAEARIAAGEKAAIRFTVNPGEIVVDDIVQGRVKFDARLIGDFIIVKSDGFPSYNYAVVIDDYEMAISHVIRGVGHLSNTPRQIIIHEALDLPQPNYAHISEIVGTDKKKLSKRRGATSILFFRDLGYTAAGFTNYMALLGWYPEDAVEFMPDGALARKFDIARCSKSPAMFDFFLNDKKQSGEPSEEIDTTNLTLIELKGLINQKSKLNFLNNKFIRHLPLEDLWPEVIPFLERESDLAARLSDNPEQMKQTFDTLRIYLNTLEESVSYMLELFKELSGPESAEGESMLAEPTSLPAVSAFYRLVRDEQPTTPEEFSTAMKKAGELSGAKGRALFMAIRVASTGTMQGLELPNLFAILGADGVTARIERIFPAAASFDASTAS